LLNNNSNQKERLPRNENRAPGGVATDNGGAVNGEPDPSVARRILEEEAALEEVGAVTAPDDTEEVGRRDEVRPLSSSLDILPVTPLAEATALDDEAGMTRAVLPIGNEAPGRADAGAAPEPTPVGRAGDAEIDAAEPAKDNEDIEPLVSAPALPDKVIGEVALVAAEVANIGLPGTALPLFNGDFPASTASSSSSLPSI